MVRPKSRRTGGCAWRLLAALLYLFAQDVAIALSQIATVSPGAVLLCHDAGSDEGGSQPPQDHAGDCALCILCHALGADTALPARFDPPPPRVADVRRVPAPPARAPPAARPRVAIFPTGPPNLA